MHVTTVIDCNTYCVGDAAVYLSVASTPSTATLACATTSSETLRTRSLTMRVALLIEWLCTTSEKTMPVMPPKSTTSTGRICETHTA